MATEVVEVPMAGTILSVKVKPGDKVKEEDEICVLEAMKTENILYAPVSGTVKEVKVTAGQTVKARDIAAVIEY